MNTCEVCRWFAKRDGDVRYKPNGEVVQLGECRINPPSGEWNWPTVKHTDWCACFIEPANAGEGKG